MHIYALDESYIATCTRMSTQDILVGVSGAALCNKESTFPWPRFSFILNSPFYLPRYAYFRELFQNDFKMSGRDSGASDSFCPFLPLHSTASRKIKWKPRGESWFPWHALAEQAAASLNRHPWISGPEEMGDAPKDVLVLFLDGQTPARYRTPAYPKRTSMSPKSASPAADEPSESTPTCPTAQGSCSQPGNKP